MKKVILVGTALMLAGCVSMGTNYDAKAVESLQIGMTRAQVVRLLGQPNQIVTASDSGQRLIWVHSTGSMFGANARSVSLPFDRNGKLVDVPK